MRRRRALGHANHERWLVSYADFITLLFAFFVVLYASAQVDKHKAGKLADAIQEGFHDLGTFSRGRAVKGNAGGNSVGKNIPSALSRYQEMERLRTELGRALAAEILRKEIVVYQGRDGLVLSLREAGFFDSASAEIKPDAMERLSRIAKVLGARPYRLRVEGHTDNMPIHNGRFNSNWELSTARATEVVRLLVTQYGFDPSMLSAAGYAEFHPHADNTTDEGRQANRRVDIVVLAATEGQEKLQ